MPIHDKPFNFSELIKRVIFKERPSYFNAQDLGKAMDILQGYTEALSDFLGIKSTVEILVSDVSSVQNTATETAFSCKYAIAQGKVLAKGVMFDVPSTPLTAYNRTYYYPANAEPKVIPMALYFCLQAELTRKTFSDDPSLCGITSDEFPELVPSCQIDQYTNVRVVATHDVNSVENLICILATFRPDVTVNITGQESMAYALFYNTKNFSDIVTSATTRYQSATFSSNKSIVEHIQEQASTVLTGSALNTIRKANMLQVGEVYLDPVQKIKQLDTGKYVLCLGGVGNVFYLGKILSQPGDLTDLVVSVDANGIATPVPDNTIITLIYEGDLDPDVYAYGSYNINFKLQDSNIILGYMNTRSRISVIDPLVVTPGSLLQFYKRAGKWYIVDAVDYLIRQIESTRLRMVTKDSAVTATPNSSWELMNPGEEYPPNTTVGPRYKYTLPSGVNYIRLNPVAIDSATRAKATLAYIAPPADIYNGFNLTIKIDCNNTDVYATTRTIGILDSSKGSSYGNIALDKLKRTNAVSTFPRTSCTDGLKYSMCFYKGVAVGGIANYYNTGVAIVQLVWDATDAMWYEKSRTLVDKV